MSWRHRTLVVGSESLEVFLGLTLFGLVFEEVLCCKGCSRLELVVHGCLLVCAFYRLWQEVVTGLIVAVRVKGGIVVFGGILSSDDHLVRHPRALMRWHLVVCARFPRGVFYRAVSLDLGKYFGIAWAELNCQK